MNESNLSSAILVSNRRVARCADSAVVQVSSLSVYVTTCIKYSSSRRKRSEDEAQKSEMRTSSASPASAVRE
jgi:hypothetical protein